MFIICGNSADFIFLTNDDFFLQSIVSGAVSGRPDAHMIYSHVLWGSILSGLYLLNPMPDWYTVFQVLTLALGVFFISFRLSFLDLRRGIRIILQITCVMLFGLLYYRNIMMLQYTITAVVVGAAAVFWMLTTDIEESSSLWFRDCIIVLALCTISYIIREMSMLMLVPFALVGWIGKWLSIKDKSQKVKSRFIIFPIVLISLIGILKLWNTMYYNSNPEWREFLRFNSAREDVVDYNGFLDYQDNQDVYSDLEISEAEYRAANDNYLILLQNHISADSLGKIAASSKEINITFGQTIKNFIERSLDYTDRPINLVAYILWILVFGFSLLDLLKNRNANSLIEIILLFVCRMTIWLYWIYKNRFPDRISQSLYYIEILMLLWIVLSAKNKQAWMRYYLYFSFIMIFLGSIRLGIPKMLAVRGECDGKTYFATSYIQLKDYTTNYKENIYFLDMNSLSAYPRANIGHDKKQIASNLVFLGSWLPNSPLVKETLDKYEIKDPTDFEDILSKDNVFFVFRDSELTSENYLLDFYSTYTNISSQEVDYIKTDCGINFRVIKLSN